MTSTVNVTYLFDPLCGWCYAAAPVLARLQATPGVQVGLAPTGLFAGSGARPMDAQFAAYAWSNDQRIEKLTGQPFSASYRDNVLGARGTRFDSGPATLALTAVAQTDPARELGAFAAFQRARYVQGLDTTSPTVLAQVLETLGLQAAAAQVRAPDDALHSAMQRRVAAARADMAALGAHGVPQLAVGDAATGRRRVVGGHALYGDLEALLRQIAE